MDNKNFQDQLGEISSLKDPRKLFAGMISYDENTIAKEFFPNKIVNEAEILKKIQDFSEKKEKFRTIIEEVQEYENFSGVQKDFIKSVAEQAILQLEYFSEAIYLEAEKSGQFSLSDAERQEKLSRINVLQNVVYGEEISQNPTETKMVLEKISELFLKNKSKLSAEQIEILENFFKKFHFTPPENSSKNSVKNDNFLKEKTFSPTENPENSPMVEIIRATLDLYGLQDYRIKINENAPNFALGYTKKVITVPKEKISSTSIFRLLQLLDHEIGVHAVRGENTLNSLRVAGNNYLDAEEGLATHSESAFDAEISDISGEITFHHIATFIAENYNAADTEKILEAIFVLQNDKNPAQSAYDRMLRVKRFVSLDLPGANRKDVSYTRGNLQISEKLQSMTVGERRDFWKIFIIQN